MKTLKKVALVLAIVFGVGLLASCEFSTVGMEKLDASDVTADWVEGKWVGAYEVVTYNSDGSVATKDKDDNYEFDFTGTIKSAAGVIALKAIATSGDLYSDPARLKVVYTNTVKSGDKVVATYKANLKKKI